MKFFLLCLSQYDLAYAIHAPYQRVNEIVILKYKIKTTDDYCKNTRKNKIDLESVNIICRPT